MAKQIEMFFVPKKELTKKEEIASYSLDEMVTLTKIKIQQYYEYFNGKVYIAYSGGRDSSVLLHIARQMYPDIKAVFNNTGLEFPEIKKIVKNTENVIWLKPAKSYQAVVKDHGFAIISKEVAQKAGEMRNSTPHIKNIRRNGYPDKPTKGRLSKKWHFLADNAPFEISSYCCEVLKKAPAKRYEKKTGMHPIIGVMANESGLRATSSNNTCNAYNAKRPISKPLLHWNNSLIKEYIKLHDIEYADLYDKGWEQTGCAWCGFGVAEEAIAVIKGEIKEGRFKRMKKTHPKIWNYAINKMGLGEVFDWINDNYKHQFYIDYGQDN